MGDFIGKSNMLVVDNETAKFNLSIDMTSFTSRTETLHRTLIVIYAIIFATGLVSNFFVICFVFMNKRMQTITNKFITNLAFADLLVIIVCIPINIGHLYKPFEWAFGWFLCVTPAFFQGVSLSVSILTLAAISLDRYYIMYVVWFFWPIFNLNYFDFILDTSPCKPASYVPMDEWAGLSFRYGWHRLR